MAREWTKKEVDELHKKLILRLYYELVWKQRDQRTWEEGMIVINQIGSL